MAINNSAIPAAFDNDFDYFSSTYENYDYADRWTVKANIDAEQPVMLSGYTDGGNFHFWIYWPRESGHQWVCDGYRMESEACGSRFWFHMNWGWR